jgi:hypothetical protein
MYIMHNDFNPIVTSLNDTLPYLNDSKFLLLHDAFLLTSSVCIDKNAFFCQSCTERSMKLLCVNDKMIEWYNLIKFKMSWRHGTAVGT